MYDPIQKPYNINNLLYLLLIVNKLQRKWYIVDIVNTVIRIVYDMNLTLVLYIK